MSDFRVGMGFDAHAFEDGVPLVLGGVRIEHPRGLAGHSDGDVLAHALTDAVLGAAGHGRHRRALSLRRSCARGRGLARAASRGMAASAREAAGSSQTPMSF